MIKHIKTVGIYVADQERALAFYTEKLGFDVHLKMPMGPNAQWIEVGPPGAESHLVIYPRSMMPDWAEKKPSIVFTCRDVEATYRDLSARGVVFKDLPKKMAWGTFAAFTDLDGNEFGIMTPHS